MCSKTEVNQFCGFIMTFCLKDRYNYEENSKTHTKIVGITGNWFDMTQ